MINDFPVSKSFNLGGLQSFQFVEYRNVDLFTGIFDSKILAPLSLKIGASWFKGYSTLYTLKFSEVSETGAQGKFYKQTISGFIPGDREALIRLMEAMDDNYFVLQVKDSSKQTRLVGGYGYPLLFSSKYDSGSNRSDGKGYEFTFYSESSFRAPVYL